MSSVQCSHTQAQTRIYIYDELISIFLNNLKISMLICAADIILIHGFEDIFSLDVSVLLSNFNMPSFRNYNEPTF